VPRGCGVTSFERELGQRCLDVRRRGNPIEDRINALAEFRRNTPRNRVRRGRARAECLRGELDEREGDEQRRQSDSDNRSKERERARLRRSKT
jgi:hypothetical protein